MIYGRREEYRMHVRWSSLCIFHDNSASGTFRQIYSTQPTHGSGIRVTAISWLPASIAGLGPTFIQSCAHIQCVYDEWFTANRNSIATFFFYNFYHKYFISFVKCQMLIGLQKVKHSSLSYQNISWSEHQCYKEFNSKIGKKLYWVFVQIPNAIRIF